MAYTLTGQRCGVVRFTPFQNGIIEKESESYTSTITRNPIEQGAEINDHLNNNSGKLNISGVIIGGDGAKVALQNMRDNRDIITYTGKIRMRNLVFTNLTFNADYKNRDGYSFSATLEQVQIASSEFVASDEAQLMTSQDAGKNDDRQLARTSNTGLTMVSTQLVSSSSAERHDAAYTQTSSSAPLTRQTGSYNGLTA